MNRFLRTTTIAATLSVLLITLSSGVRAQSRSPQAAIDQLTDHYFYRVHPALGRRIRSSDSAYIREWQAIQNRLEGNLIKNEDCGDGSPTLQWVVATRFLDSVADGIFHSRYPALNGREIQPDEVTLVAEWDAIRQSLSEEHQCY